MSGSIFFPDDIPPAGETATEHSHQIGPAIDEARSQGKREQQITDETQAAAILAYIPVLCFVPLLQMRNNPEALFHARQGVLLFFVELVAVLLLVDGIANFVFKLILVAALACSGVAIYYVIQGKRVKIPILSEIAEKVNV